MYMSFLQFAYLYVHYFHIFQMKIWNLFLCFLNVCLEQNTFSQKRHGIDIPSTWFASMWYLIDLSSPSFPQTLQIKADLCLADPFGCFPAGIRLRLFSIIDFTILSSAWRSPLNLLGMSSDLEILSSVFAFVTLSLITLSLQVVVLFNDSLFCSTISGFTCFSSSRNKSAEDWPESPSSFSSSATARKDSKFSW